MKAAGCCFLSGILLVLSCSKGGEAPTHFFSDVTGESGIEFQIVNGAQGRRYLVETMIGGLGWIDYDGDGDGDLYVVNGHSDPLRADSRGKEENKLFRNDGAGGFTDVTAAAKVGDSRYGFGVAVGDYDNDGARDLFVANFGRDTLYHNNGDGTFTDVSEEAGFHHDGWSSSAVWFDMDRDGDLDLYVVRYLNYHPGSARRCAEGGRPVYCHPRHFAGAPDLLYRNNGDGSFDEIGSRAGIARAGAYDGKGLGVVAVDFDRDGLCDVYVANDTTANFLWRSNGDQTFTDIGQESGVALSADGKSQAGMGVDVADVDGDGITDIYVTNFGYELNALYLGGRNGQFSERTQAANLQSTYRPLGFGTLFLDVDLDGDQDNVTVNGHINDIVSTTDPGKGSTYRQLPALFLNDGKGRFTEATEGGGPFFAERVVGRGLAACDFDDDGDVDLAAMTLDRSVVLLRNNSPRAHRSVTLRLVGTRSPRDAYGARLEAEVGERTQLFEYQSARSYLSACDPRVVVGLGEAEKIDRLRVFWPSGQVTERSDVKAGSRLTIEEGR